MYVPDLVYYYNAKNMTLEISNVGSEKATGITIEIDPDRKSSLIGGTHLICKVSQS